VPLDSHTPVVVAAFARLEEVETVVPAAAILAERHDGHLIVAHLPPLPVALRLDFGFGLVVPRDLATAPSGLSFPQVVEVLAPYPVPWSFVEICDGAPQELVRLTRRLNVRSVVCPVSVGGLRRWCANTADLAARRQAKHHGADLIRVPSIPLPGDVATDPSKLASQWSR